MFTLWLWVVKTKTCAMENKYCCLLKAIPWWQCRYPFKVVPSKTWKEQDIIMCITEMYIMVYKSFKCWVSLWIFSFIFLYPFVNLFEIILQKLEKQRKIIWWKNQYISLTKEITTELQYCNSHHNSVYLMVLYVMSEKYTVMQRNVIY